MAKSFARNTLYSTVAGFVISIGRFATTVAMARVLGVQETGVAAFELWLISLVCAVTNLGVYASLARYLPELKSNNEARQFTRFLLFPFVAVTLIIAVSFATFSIADGLSLVGEAVTRAGNTNIFLAVLLYIIQSLSSFALGYLVGRQEFRNFAALALISNFMQVPLVVLAGMKWGVDGVLLGYIAGGLPFAFLCFSLTLGKPSLPPQLRHRLGKYAAYSWASTLAYELVWARLEMAFLGYFWGSAAVGLYSVGFTLASLATQGPLLLTGALLPYFAEAISSGRMERAKAMLRTAIGLVAFFVLPICFGVAALIPEFLPLIYGKSFASGSSAAIILVSAAGLGTNIVVPLNFINGMERSDFLFVLNITGAILSIVMGFVLASSLGIIGAALARASVQLYLLAVSFWFLKYRLGCAPPLTQLGLIFASALVSACVAGLVASQISGMPGLLLAVLSGVLVYIFLVRLLRAIPDEDIERLRELFEHTPIFLQRGIGFALRVISRK